MNALSRVAALALVPAALAGGLVLFAEWVVGPTPVPVDTLGVPTSYGTFTEPRGLTAVRYPTLFFGRTFLAPDEELWPILKIPKDPDANTRVDRLGGFKVTSSRPVAVDVHGDCSTKVDIGRDGCDKSKIYQLLIVRARQTTAAGSGVIEDLQRQGQEFPEFTERALPPGLQPLGAVDVQLVDYKGGHTQC